MTSIHSHTYGFNIVIKFTDGRKRHAFIGLGFRERTEAYDFQASLHDHMKYPIETFLRFTTLIFLLPFHFT